jgi:putative addiction module killer protein
VHELRLDFGPGYRVYYAMETSEMVLLLGGGDKSDQQGDIKSAKERWKQCKAGVWHVREASVTE